MSSRCLNGTELSKATRGHNQNLHSAMRPSAVWVYQEFVKAIGEKRARSYLEGINYDNQCSNNPTGGCFAARFNAQCAVEYVVVATG